MKSFHSVRSSAMVLSVLVALAWSGGAADWPRWRGPNLDGLCQETGLLQTWPEKGPPLLWKAGGFGEGYSSVAIAQGKLYTMGDVSVGERKTQAVLCFDLGTRKTLWVAKVGPPHGDGGSRCTPTVDDGRVYAIGTEGDLVCVEAATGQELWRKNFGKDFGGKMMSGWRYSESPLVDGNKLVCTPGGRQAVLVALNKITGQTLWKTALPEDSGRGKDGAGYSSIVISEGAGVRQYVQITGHGCIGVAADDGKFLWNYDRIANRTANIPTAVVDGDYVFCSTAYNTGAALLKLVPKGQGGVKADEVYFLDESKFQNHHGGFVRLGEFIYGGHGQNKGEPTCIEMKTGNIRWQKPQPGGGSAAVLAADGNLIFRYDKGQVCLVAASPNSYQLKGKFTPPKERGMDGPAWAHPVISDAKLYLRHGDLLHCFDLKGP